MCPVNYVDNAATQEAQVAVSTQAILNQAEQISKEAAGNKETAVNKGTSKIKDLIESRGRKSTVKLISGLFETLSSLGLKSVVENVSQSGNKHTLESEKAASSETKYEDLVDLKDPILRVARRTQSGRSGGQGTGEDQTQAGLSKEAQEAATLYPQLFAEYLVGATPEIKKKLNQLETLLEEQGVATKEIKNLQSRVSNSIRSELTQQIKNAYLQRFLAKPKSLDATLSNRQLSDVIKLATENPKIGGADFEGFRGDFKATEKEVVDSVKEDVKDFVRNETEKLLVKGVMHDQADKGEIKRLFELGIRAGLDLDDLINHMRKQKEEFGLTPFTPPQTAASFGGGTTSQHSDSDNQQPIFDQDDQKEFFINSLRSIYMQRALKGDFTTKLQTSFKMRKLKNEVIRLGVTIEEVDKIEKEGVALARMQFIKMLQEFYLERASFYHFEGPAYQLNQRKVKSTLSNLERLGFELTAEEQKAFIDEANREMYYEVVKEINETEAALKLRRHPALERKLSQLMKITARICEETKIPGATSNLKLPEYKERSICNLKTIAEAV